MRPEIITMDGSSKSERENGMSSTKDEKDMSNRREFFQGAASGVAGAAMLAAVAQMGVPVLNAAQGGEAKPDAKPKQAESPFFRNPPPWPRARMDISTIICSA